MQNQIPSHPHPIGFSIPEEKIVTEIPLKDLDFAHVTGREKIYIYKTEEPYYKGYQRSYFALTWKKSGWDCLRHYEILANGCIPYFPGLEGCHENTMTFFPKKLVFEAMRLDGVYQGSIDHSKFDKAKYFDLLSQILAHTREHLSTKAMANYVLKTMRYTGKKKILYLAFQQYPDLLRDMTLGGLKSLLGNQVVDLPKIEHIYKSYDKAVSWLHARGFSYAKIVDDIPVDRENIEERIKNREFEIIIYGSAHRGLLFHHLIHQYYQPSEIAYLCGQDAHITQTPKTPYNKMERCPCEFRGARNLFLREFDIDSPLEPYTRDLVQKQWKKGNPFHRD